MVTVAMAVPDKRESNDTVPSNQRHLPRNVAGRSRSKKPQEARGSHFTPEEPVSKFYRELRARGIRYGLMVSLTSGIAGAAVLKSIVLYEARADAACPIPLGAVEQ